MANATSSERRTLYLAMKRSQRSRQEAIQQAVEAGDRVVPWLVGWLQDKDPNVRWAAAEALKRIGSATVVDHLLKNLTVRSFEPSQGGRRREREIEDARRAVVERMRLVASSSRMAPGVANFAAELPAQRPFNRRAAVLAIEVLQPLSDPRIVPKLIELLDHPDRSVAVVAANALARVGQQDAMPIVKVLMKLERLQRFRRFVRPVIALGLTLACVFTFYFYSSEVGGIKWGTVLGALVSGLLAVALVWSSRKAFRRRSIEAFQVLQDSRAIGAILLCTQDKHLASMAIESLKPLLEMVDDEHPVTLTPNQMRVLLSLLYYPDDALRLRLIRALEYIGDESALEALEKFSQDFETSTALRELATTVIPGLKERIARRAEARVLLRAPPEEAEAATLLRSAQGNPEILEEQLLCPADG